jgi:tRNA modification GTPase
VSETVIALLTPPGKAALATIAVTGPRAWETVRALFHPRSGSALAELPESGQFRLGRLGDAVSEEAVLAVRSIEPILLELHVHGGYEVTRYLLELFAECGDIPVSWQQMLQRYESDSIRGMAANVLACTTTTRTAAIALDQYQGAFRAFLRQTEALIVAGEFERARKVVQDVLRYADVGRHLTAPWRVVIAGAPNVGKSSLVNALAGYHRSVVSPTTGTTRDVVTAQLAIDGWPVEVVDTAGLRVGGEALEEMGIDQACAAVAESDLAIWLVDASAEPVWPDDALHTLRQLRIVVNKIDLPARWGVDEGFLSLSATTGQGVPELVAALGTWLVSDPPPAGAAVPCTNEMIEHLLEAGRLLAGTPAASAEAVLVLLRECGRLG